MAKVIDNDFTVGVSGKLGKQIVFRRWKGATFLTKAPIRSVSSYTSETQVKIIQRFKEAAAYAKNAVNDPELKQFYLSKCKDRQNAYNRAIQDFYSVPVIRDIDLSNCTGETGSFIRVNASDDFRVKKVQIQIEDDESRVVESGLAVQDGNTSWWKFSVTTPDLLPKTGKVIVTVFDLPGNEVTAEAIF